MKNELTIAICDDDSIALDIISASVSSTFFQHGISVDIHKFTKCKELNNEMSRIVFDLLILDIEMPNFDGIEFGNRLRNKGNDINIIYVSNREERVFEALHVQPQGFIRKSQFLKDISFVLNSFINSYLKKEREVMVIEDRDKLISFRINDIEYIEGCRKNQLVYLKRQKEPISIAQTMQKLEEMLEERGFLRIHKGYLVNYRYIYLIGETDITLNNKVNLPISRRKVKEIRSQYFKLMKDNGAVTI